MAGGGHGGGGKAVVAAFFANLGIAIAKFIGFAFTGSSSMLAEGRVRARVPAARLMFLEPDLRRPVPGSPTAGVASSAAAGPLVPELPRPH